jgi:hypothetical protein
VFALAAASLAAAGDARAGAALVARTELFDGSRLRIESPSGITRLPDGRFAIVDAEIERSPRFRSENLWEVDLAGRRSLRSVDLTGVTAEPSDVAWCPPLDALLVTDDDELRLHRISRSGAPAEAIDLAALGARDPEGVACAPEIGRIFVADGKGRQVLELTLEGAPVRRIDLSGSPFRSAEGIGWDPARGRLLVVSDDPPALFELTREGSLVAAFDLEQLGLVRPGGVTLAPAGSGPGTSLYVVDGGVRQEADGRIFELALSLRPERATSRTQLLGDVDGFGFRGDEPGFALGDLDHDGLLEPGERLPDAPLERPARDPADVSGTDEPVAVGEGRPLVLEHALALGSEEPVWARLSLVVGGARALGGRRNVVRADGHLLGEVLPTRDARIHPGMIGATVLELPPEALRDLRDGHLRVEIAREPGTGSDELWVDSSRLEVSTVPARAPASPSAPPGGGPGALNKGGDS